MGSEFIVNSAVLKELILDGLDCVNCASKIEKQVNGINGVKNSSLNFTTKKLKIEIGNGSWENIFDEASQIIRSIEPHVNIIENNKENKIVLKNKAEVEKSEKIKYLIIAAGAVLFLVATIFKFTFWIEFALYLAGYILTGGNVVLSAARNILRGQVFDENFLMTVATIGAFAIKEFPEAVAVMLFYQIGEFFQDLAVNRSRKSISDLMNIRPDYATLLIGSEEKRIDPDKVKTGDRIIVKPGEKIPLDGRILEGMSSVNTSALTGESVPRYVSAGDDVLAGFININGVLIIEVTKEFGESTAAKILDLVENAAGKKAQTEKFITKFARYYTPAMLKIFLLKSTIDFSAFPAIIFSIFN